MTIKENLTLEEIDELSGEIKSRLAEDKTVKVSIKSTDNPYNLSTQQFLLVLIQEANNSEQLMLTLGDTVNLSFLDPVANRLTGALNE